MIEIAGVLPDSTAARHGLNAGERIVSINGCEVRDSIDYQYLVSDERLSLKVQCRDGTVRTVRFSKETDDTLGLWVKPFHVRQCRNKCIFCFVDQMPAGCRKTLYVRDDDYRASFLHGNYITLTNLREDDWQRILDQRLSPLYISVHTTDPVLRASIMRGGPSRDILACLERLAEAGIALHTQIVLCPGINDGQHLIKSIDDLAGLHPAVRSIAVVPVGLTSHRKGLFPLRSFRKREARSVISTIHRLAGRLKNRLGTRLVFPSDEFYIKAGVKIPPLSAYEELPQIENGVGMVASFLSDAKHTRIPSQVKPEQITVVTGVSFAPILASVLKRLNRIRGVSTRMITVRNRLFGPSVTVAGLLAGRDILNAVKGKRLGSLLVIPADSLKEGENIFIDDVSLSEVESAAGVPIHAAASFSELVDQIVARDTSSRRRRKA